MARAPGTPDLAAGPGRSIGTRGPPGPSRSARISGRADGAGCSKQWLAHLRALRDDRGLDVSFSVGFTMTEQVQTAILALPQWRGAGGPSRWIAARGRRGGRADRAAARPGRRGWPERMRVIVRRERPHPGAQLTFTDIHGWRFQAFATDTPAGQLAALETRHRAHATVEDRIRCGKDTGLGRFRPGCSRSTPPGSSSR
jgi:hypothetical protein